MEILAGKEGDSNGIEIDVNITGGGAAWRINLKTWTENPLCTMLSNQQRKRYLQALVVAFIILWALLAIHPLYRSDWWLENILIFAAVPLLWYVHRSNPLST